ncbi:unnamed protein product [Arabidopsis thaliana]|uniref:Transmembrane protein n=1 Tax=Arabidopsis thaliana TaxID=3702 RepID=A0A654EV63_ARATH|nr:unnamed protein product [Arabidopsis thaliana]
MALTKKSRRLVFRCYVLTLYATLLLSFLELKPSLELLARGEDQDEERDEEERKEDVRDLMSL